MLKQLKNISVYGAGSWGTALALQLARNGVHVLLWDINSEHIKRLSQERTNSFYLPNIAFPTNLQCSDSLRECVEYSDYQLLVIPSHGFRSLIEKISPLLKLKQYKQKVFWATKGLELGTGKLLHEVALEILPPEISYGVVSGPTFAREVASGLPTAMTVASNSYQATQVIAKAFQDENYRVYTCDDVIGVELGGAIKNVLAIAAGISDGLGYGANARAAIITRGLAEIIRLGKHLGAKSETLMGLAGVGDLVLTCTDDQSRNRRLGLAIGQGQDKKSAIKAIGQAVEGEKSSHSVDKLAKRAGIEMPICEQVHLILHKRKKPELAVKELLARQQKAEF